MFNQQGTILDWMKNPTIDILESLSYPIEEIDFPTVTICPEDSNPDRWGLIIKIFDHMKYECEFG